MTEDEYRIGSGGAPSSTLAEAEEPEALRRRALAVARRCAVRLKEEFSARRVYLFGSLATGEFRSDSDIDLAVEGMGFRPYLRAVAELSFAEGFRVDVVHLDFCKPKAQERVEREGEVLV